MKLPCKECVVYAICKLKTEIICNEAIEYCRDYSFAYTEYNTDRIHEVIDYLGKGGAFEANNETIVFSDVFDHEGEKLN